MTDDVRSIREIKAHAYYSGARDPANLPGNAVRTDTHNARLTFELDGRREIRYFARHSDGYRTKKNYAGIWRPHTLQYWNVKYGWTD